MCNEVLKYILDYHQMEKADNRWNSQFEMYLCD
jgi:hypothetical protein